MLLEKKSPSIFLVGKGLSNDDVEVARGTVFQEVRPGAGFKSDDLFKKSLGGYRRTAPHGISRVPRYTRWNFVGCR